MPFPVIKLVFLGLKQISKPLAKVIQKRAMTSPFLRNYILLPPAQFYHIVETNVKLRLLGLGKSHSVKKLDENMAIQLSSEMLGEMVVFSIATACLYLEYRRGQRNDQRKEDVQNERLVETEERLEELQRTISRHEEHITQLLQTATGTTTTCKTQTDNTQTDNTQTDKTKLASRTLVNTNRRWWK